MLQANHWEHHLLDLAHQALDSGVVHTQTVADQALLTSAYQRCEQITRDNSKTFFMASSLLPAEKRRATRALYAFCRLSDDIVDQPRANRFNPAEVSSRLETWRQQIVFGHHHPSHEVQVDGAEYEQVRLAWADARRSHYIPRGYVDQLIDGLALDLSKKRYETFDELAKYCYGVACTVGLMSMHITGYSGREAIPYAIRLGVALQLTNILRDVGEDWRSGRLYLPREELQAFGLDEEFIARGKVDQRWRSFMRFQIDRARSLYKEALPGVRMLSRDGRFAIGAAGELYRLILNEIEANDYNVFNKRASVSAWNKLSRLPGIWMRANTASEVS